MSRHLMVVPATYNKRRIFNLITDTSPERALDHEVSRVSTIKLALEIWRHIQRAQSDDCCVNLKRKRKTSVLQKGKNWKKRVSKKNTNQEQTKTSAEFKLIKAQTSWQNRISFETDQLEKKLFQNQLPKFSNICLTFLSIFLHCLSTVDDYKEVYWIPKHNFKADCYFVYLHDY